MDKELPWDEVTRAVARAVVQHRPDATATEAYFHMMVQHIAGVLWRLGAGDRFAATGQLTGNLTKSAAVWR